MTLHIIYNFLFLLAGWRWGDWRNWEKYYPTILFFILNDLLQNFLTYNHQFWDFQENIMPLPFLNHTTISLMIMFVCYPVTILIYLGNFFRTDKWGIKIVHYLIWVVLYLAVEYINLHVGLISHYNGWTMWHSVLFVSFMFILFPIHYKKPLLAWVIGVSVLVFILTQFEFPLDKMK
jgi:hypothetical protein